MLAREFSSGAGTSTKLFHAWLALVVFAILGSIIGYLAGRIVEDWSGANLRRDGNLGSAANKRTTRLKECAWHTCRAARSRAERMEDGSMQEVCAELFMEDCMFNDGRTPSRKARGRRRHPGSLEGLQDGSERRGPAKPSDRALPAAGEIQRRANLGAVARRGRARRPHLGRRLWPDGCDRRIRSFPRASKFETYCVPRIRGAMLDELRTMDWVPRLVRSKASKLNEGIKTLEAKLGRPAEPKWNWPPT